MNKEVVFGETLSCTHEVLDLSNKIIEQQGSINDLYEMIAICSIGAFAVGAVFTLLLYELIGSGKQCNK